MDLNNRIQTFIALGKTMAGFPDGLTEGSFHPLSEAVLQAEAANPWFTQVNIRHAINAIGQSMTALRLKEWLLPYTGLIQRPGRPSKTVGVVMAGNIPLAGFHDFLSVLICGHRIKVKLSSQDDILIPAVARLMTESDERWDEMLEFSKEPFKKFDAIIATGSDNTFRYFDYYFNRYPHLLRRNRNSIAVLTGEETSSDLEGLADDIMMYFGLGCRNISKIYVPRKYDLNVLQPCVRVYESMEFHNKYRNNYDYQKSIFLVNKKPFTDFGNLLLVEDQRIPSPVSVLHVERYGDPAEPARAIRDSSGLIQCVVCHRDPGVPFVLPGTAQQPALPDYADGADTLKFLLDEIYTKNICISNKNL